MSTQEFINFPSDFHHSVPRHTLSEGLMGFSLNAIATHVTPPALRSPSARQLLGLLAFSSVFFPGTAHAQSAFDLKFTVRQQGIFDTVLFTGAIKNLEPNTANQTCDGIISLCEVEIESYVSEDDNPPTIVPSSPTAVGVYSSNLPFSTGFSTNDSSIIGGYYAGILPTSDPQNYWDLQLWGEGPTFFSNFGVLAYVRIGGISPQINGDLSFQDTTTPPQSSSVPGPLPVLGAAVGFGFSRKLRNRIKVARTTAPTRPAD